MSIRKGIRNIMVGALAIWLVKEIIAGIVSPNFVEGLTSILLLVISAFILNVVGQYVIYGIKRIVPSSASIPSLKSLLPSRQSESK